MDWYTFLGFSATSGAPVRREDCSPALECCILLTTTDFLNYRLCAGYAWLSRHRPAETPDTSDPGSRRREAADAELQLLARELCAHAVEIDMQDIERAAAATAEAMANDASAIHGATVVTGRGIVGRADTLIREDDDRWVYRLARATTSIKTEHVQEAAFGVRAFAEAGVEIAGVQLALLHKRYRRGGALDISALLAVEDITQRVGKIQAGVARDMDAALAILGNADRPGICRCDLGTRGQRCPAFGLFHPEVGTGNTVYDLGGVSGRKLDTVLARGISRLADWPDDVEVTSRQRQQIDVLRSGGELVDKPRLRAFLAHLRYPLHFLDYETFQTAVPLFAGCFPWSQIPFQYSIHVANADGDLSHREFLWTERDRLPVPALLAQLRQDIGDSGSIVVWNKGFERTRNLEMADMAPASASFLHDINARMVDLMDVVKDGMWVHSAFNGSASIKKVLPVAAPELSYDALDIGEGMAAAEHWVQAVLRDSGRLTEDERANVFQALRIYCHQDTLAMVRVLEHVQSLLDRA